MKDRGPVSRRTLVTAGLGAVAAPAILRVIPAHAQSRIVKIGHVSPKTGPLAGFGEADPFILDQVRGILSKGLSIGGKIYPVEIISKDSQSSGSRASDVASELILGDKVDLIVASAAPDTTNPVADQAELTARTRELLTDTEARLAMGKKARERAANFDWQGSAAPQPGDNLVFPASASGFNSINNFPTGSVFGSIRPRLGRGNFPFQAVVMPV